jgi:hypothetical protein
MGEVAIDSLAARGKYIRFSFAMSSIIIRFSFACTPVQSRALETSVEIPGCAERGELH